MTKNTIYISMVLGLPIIIGIIWAGGILTTSFSFIFDEPKQPVLGYVGAVASLFKTVSCACLLIALRHYDTSECRILLIINIILTAIFELMFLPVYFLTLSIRTPFDISAITITLAYSCCLLVFLLILPSKKSNKNVVATSATP